MAKGDSKVGGGAKGGKQRNGYTSIDDLESKLNGPNDERATQFSDAYAEENGYTRDLINNIEQSIGEDGYDDFTDRILEGEKNTAQRELDNMPELKTPEQLGTAAALEERIEQIERLRKRGREQGNRRERRDVDITVTRRR